MYFDSSALVKLVVEEDGTDLAAALWDGCDASMASRLAYPEVRAALAAASRHDRLDDDELNLAERDWAEFWSAVRPVELTDSVAREAGDLARTYQLRGADAVHLASALALGSADLVLAAWDQRLRAGAQAVGLPISPSQVP